MKKLMVYDIAAESGGALTMLNFFYEAYKNDSKYECWFVVSVPEYLEEPKNHIIRLPWVKKSWLHRLYCDYIYMPRLIKQIAVEEVLSLQNIGIPRCPVHQTVYVHNAIPFTEYRFSLIKDPFLWVYQNIIGRMTYRSLKKVDEIIVQTQWMKNEIVKKCNISESRVFVQAVKSSMEGCSERITTTHPLFFYPATPLSFKNHAIVLDACRALKKEGIVDYEVIFTLDADENKLSMQLAQIVEQENLAIKFVGRLGMQQMREHYQKSILLFPSYLETIGLPLLEAQEFHAPILASNCAYAREAVGNYAFACFFDAHSADELAKQMRLMIQGN